MKRGVNLNQDRLRSVVRTSIETLFPRYTWDGVYNDFPKTTDAFGSDWATDTYQMTQMSLEVSRIGSIPRNVVSDASLLPLSIAMLGKEKPTILDFGGGVGIGYVHLTGSTNSIVDYHIIETEAVCREGEKLFSEIRFHSEIPEIKPDVLHINGAIQYVQSCWETLEKLLALKPEYVLFVRLTAGDVDTYVTLQMNMKNPVPVWFFNVSEFIAFIETRGYRLIFKGATDYICRQENFSPQQRIGTPVNLLFRKINCYESQTA